MRDWLKAFFNLGKIARILLHRTGSTRRSQKAIMSAFTDLQAAVASLDAKIVAHMAADGPKDEQIAALTAERDAAKAEIASMEAAAVELTAQVVAAEAKLS